MLLGKKTLEKCFQTNCGIRTLTAASLPFIFPINRWITHLLSFHQHSRVRLRPTQRANPLNLVKYILSEISLVNAAPIFMRIYKSLSAHLKKECWCELMGLIGGTNIDWNFAICNKMGIWVWKWKRFGNRYFGLVVDARLHPDFCTFLDNAKCDWGKGRI